MIFVSFYGTILRIQGSTQTKSMSYRPKIGKTVYLWQESAELGLGALDEEVAVRGLRRGQQEQRPGL